MLVSGYLVLNAIQSNDVTTWGNAESFKSETSYGFNYQAAGFNGIPEIVIFQRSKVEKKEVPGFTSVVTAEGGNSYTVTIDGAQIIPKENTVLLYINNNDGKLVEFHISQENAQELIKADHKGYIKFWNNFVDPRLETHNKRNATDR